MDWECEIAFVVGARARYVEAKDWAKYIAGYCICNDVSERRFQSKRGGQWVKGKSAETFGPLGPWLVTPDEIPDPHNLAMSLDVNGVAQADRLDGDDDFQDPRPARLRHRVHGSRARRHRNDGHAAGRRLREKPPEYLKAGDVMELRVEGLGVQRQKVVAFTA